MKCRAFTESLRILLLLPEINAGKGTQRCENQEKNRCRNEIEESTRKKQEYNGNYKTDQGYDLTH